MPRLTAQELLLVKALMLSLGGDEIVVDRELLEESSTRRLNIIQLPETEIFIFRLSEAEAEPDDPEG